MSLQQTSREAHASAIKAHIKKGYVLHIDPDYLLLTYGDCLTGELPRQVIGARYAMCLGVEGDATFWVLLSTQDHDYSREVPDAAKSGAWSDNPRPSFFSTTNIWVLSRDMVADAHLQVNTVKAQFRHSMVNPARVPDWPDTPIYYPKSFTPIDRIQRGLPKVALEIAAEGAPQVASVEDPMPTPMPEATVSASPEPATVGTPSRTDLIERAQKLLANPRLTNDEAFTLVEHLEADVITTLIGF